MWRETPSPTDEAVPRWRAEIERTTDCEMLFLNGEWMSNTHTDVNRRSRERERRRTECHVRNRAGMHFLWFFYLRQTNTLRNTLHLSTHTSFLSVSTVFVSWQHNTVWWSPMILRFGAFDGDGTTAVNMTHRRHWQISHTIKKHFYMRVHN